MGAHQSARACSRGPADQEVNFDHFQILRAIGKGSFGKVCIVQKKDCKRMFAMKYMNKSACVERDALRNVLREVDILASLEHPFLVNLWFSFQDEEDLFMVSDLLLGGDLRYHISQRVRFSEACVQLYVCELAMALDYLHSRRIVHRDVKPDNILLNEEGHAHLTDFNIATVLEPGQLATSMSGTKPYMAPEIFECAADACLGYGPPVDWWSLGVVAFEALCGARPFDIHSGTSVAEVRALLQRGAALPAAWSPSTRELVAALLSVRPGARVSSMEELRKLPCYARTDFAAVLRKEVKPDFVPPKDHLNCDPTFELEEMIIETRPLHKKKKRLAKQRSLREIQGSVSVDMVDCDLPAENQLSHVPEFRVYNRERVLAMEQKEKAWEEELAAAMAASEAVSAVVPAAALSPHSASCPRLDSTGAPSSGNNSSSNGNGNGNNNSSSSNSSAAHHGDRQRARSGLLHRHQGVSFDAAMNHLHDAKAPHPAQQGGKGDRGSDVLRPATTTPLCQ
ncbi:serine/threonine-protein kinase 32A [Schistocerca piceifrons]|uniref:serine/threonine-protein kinase 32A n=1 Tax=Schistocerca piceifrons TaxID=274613 RepID=UPI001F5E4F32|nr:serine/threonine-protein kinase 32A [Schistocerca piceifrons]